jgi:hypothetical protein
MSSRRSRGVAVLALSAALVVHGSADQKQTAISLRFDHLHYRVPDPGEALGAAARQLNGTRTILQGVGVGVRAGREYVLFDRGSGQSAVPSGSAGLAPADAYRQAARWLTDRGLGVEPAALPRVFADLRLDGATFDHVGFAADDPALVRNAIKDVPLVVSDDLTKYQAVPGLVVEVVRDTDRPDAYWCPMHPDVRGPDASKCPRCGMALVPIPPPRIGEYRLDVTLHPRRGGGITGLSLAVRDPETGERVPGLLDVHERPFHLFILSRDLTFFAHVHPELRQNSALDLKQALEPGQYILVADFLPAGGTPQLVQRAIVTPGYAGPLFQPAPALTPGPRDQVVDGLRIAIETAVPVRAQRESLISFRVSDAGSGAAVSDLEPYLGASGHLLVVNADATSALHAHPEGSVTSGPVLTFGPVFPSPGRYKMWVQLQRKGRVVTAPFVIDVPPASF